MNHTMKTDRPGIAIAAVLALCLLVVPAFSSSEQDRKVLQEHYGLIFGTAYGPDDRPLYGVRITIHPFEKKHPNWEWVSDHRGEFAQRVPPGPADYVITGQIEVVPLENGKPQASKKKRLKGEAKVHIESEERHDFSLHLTEQKP